MATPRQAKRRGRLSLLVGTVFATALFSTVAYADDIVNNLDASVDAVAEIMPLEQDGANGTTKLYVVPQNGDGKNGCNLTGSTTLGISLASSDTSVATVSPSSITFEACGDQPIVTVTPHSAGSATISATLVSNSTGGTFNLSPATFRVVVAPPPNTPPSVVVAGVTGGASYNKGSVPAATCNVTDAEDGNSSFAATLSAITGTYASDGIGAQTASCSYTDGGGATAQASETYNIVDPSPPIIDSPIIGTLGNNGWYTSDVSLNWTVSDAQSPNSLQTTGCVDQTITSDQGATTYSCSASSAGGSAGPVDITIKRDATDPTISGSATPAANTNGWRNSDVTVSFTCDDALSGVASCEANHVLGEGYDQSATGHATDLAGNSDSATVSGINVDKGAPNAPAIGADRAADYTDGDGNEWYSNSVTLSFSGNGDPDLADGHAGSGVDPASIPASVSRSTTGALTASGSVTDRAGNESAQASRTANVDADAPTAAFTNCPTSPLLLNSSATASWSASDVGSGLASAASGSVTLDTSSVGSHVVESPAPSDNVGKIGAKATCAYSVSYKFVGFFSPVDNGILNTAKAGQAIPFKWRLLDANNQPITDLASVSAWVKSLSCTGLGITTDAVEEYATGASGLQNLGNGYYQWNWKTPSSYAGSCKTFYLDIGDGTPRTAMFKFTK